MSWTDERVEALRKLWMEGRTASQIAKELGDVTRNAVIGKVHRLGLSGRPSPIKRKQKRTTEVVKKAKPTQKIVQNVQPIRSIVQDEVAVAGGASLLDLKERMCKWPIGDPKSSNFRFCGQKSSDGLPYCEHHAMQAYHAPSRRRSKLNEDELARL